jgi:uncharacterized membrane-anchored protein YitT (DUF2179 family)
MTFTEVRKEVQSYFIMTIGLFISSIGWAGFIIPSKIIGGGITGVATVIYYMVGWDIGLMALLMNAILILLAIKIIGASFGVKTIYAVVVFSLLLSFITRYLNAPLLEEKMMATLTGSILAGFGGSLVLLNGGSTGGTEIIALIINKYKNISLGRLLLTLDSIIITSSFLLFQSIETMVYGFMTMAIFAYTIDLAISGTKQTVQIFIFSKKHEELQDHIINVARRGLTVLPGQGGFSGEPVNVLMVIARKSESHIILRIIKQIDPEAFITMGSVMGVYGKGFDTIKG